MRVGLRYPLGPVQDLVLEARRWAEQGSPPLLPTMNIEFSAGLTLDVFEPSQAGIAFPATSSV